MRTILTRLRQFNVVAPTTVALAVVVGAASGQVQAIRVGPNLPLSQGLEQRPPREPHLAIHPTNPRHLLGAAMLGVVTDSFEEMNDRLGCASFVSLDDGQTWDRHDFPLTNCYDPWVAITADGQAVFTALAIHA